MLASLPAYVATSTLTSIELQTSMPLASSVVLSWSSFHDLLSTYIPTPELRISAWYSTQISETADKVQIPQGNGYRVVFEKGKRHAHIERVTDHYRLSYCNFFKIPSSEVSRGPFKPFCIPHSGIHHCNDWREISRPLPRLSLSWISKRILVLDEYKYIRPRVQ